VIKVIAFSLYGSLAASHRIRLSQFTEGLYEAEISLEINSLLDNHYLKSSFSGKFPSLYSLLASYIRRFFLLLKLGEYDLVIVYAELFPYAPAWMERILLTEPYIYDFDDAFYLKYKWCPVNFLVPFLGRKIDKLISNARSVNAGNRRLASYAKAFNSSVSLMPSVVDTYKFKPSEVKPASNPQRLVTIGWIGSPSTAPYLEIIVEALEHLALELPIRLLVVGGIAPVLRGVECINLEWSEQSEVAYIQAFDIGVMPLPNTPWAAGKCAFKLIQYMSCGVPVVASSIGANIDVVTPECGFLAETTEQWYNALRLLAESSDLRHIMGSNSRSWILQKYSLNVVLPKFERSIRSALL